jgi:hypothetical protein
VQLDAKYLDKNGVGEIPDKANPGKAFAINNRQGFANYISDMVTALVK